MEKGHPDFLRFQALKWDLEHGARLPKHKLLEFKRLQKAFLELREI